MCFIVLSSFCILLYTSANVICIKFYLLTYLLNSAGLSVHCQSMKTKFETRVLRNTELSLINHNTEKQLKWEIFEIRGMSTGIFTRDGFPEIPKNSQFGVN